MTWHLLMFHVTVKDGERALLTRNGRLERVLEPGRHSLFDTRRELAAEVFSVVRAEFPAERYAARTFGMVVSSLPPMTRTSRSRRAAIPAVLAFRGNVAMISRISRDRPRWATSRSGDGPSS